MSLYGACTMLENRWTNDVTCAPAQAKKGKHTDGVMVKVYGQVTCTIHVGAEGSQDDEFQ
jgi:hypothetical protein